MIQNVTLTDLRVTAISAGNVRVSKLISIKIYYVDPLCIYSILNPSFQQIELDSALGEIPFGTESVVYQFYDVAPFDKTNTTELTKTPTACNIE